MPDPMYRALEDIVELVVDGDYEELRVMSRDRLEVEDMRRRVEDDCRESLVLPPREIYRVETTANWTTWKCRAGPTELWTETARRACTSRASSRSRASAHGDAERHPALIRRAPRRMRARTRKAHPQVDSRPSEDQAAFAGRDVQMKVSPSGCHRCPPPA